MKPAIKKTIRWTGIGLGLIVIGVVTFALITIGPSNVWGMLRYDTREEGALDVGHRAPDVSLLALDGHTRVALSERMGERPLVVIFGSYT
ncbi:MAG TPA: hypothetical protein VGS22_28890 [Thermoanaerobaculia bacterium]|jgi:hypothetical protein|nr:hypothetical protein [Thermoanaerobaculia bacterium]